MKRILLYVTVGILAYCGFLVAKLPAAVAYGFVDKQVQPLTLTGVEGTAWKGRALQVAYQRQTLGAVEWSLKPFSLLFGGVAADVRLDSAAGDAMATVTGRFDGSALIENMDGELDVSRLAPLVQLQSFRPEGTLQVQLQQLEIRDQRPVQAMGELLWRDARIQSPRALPLGGLVATLSTTPQGIRAVLRDRESPFALDAIVNLRPNGAYRLSGKLAARGEAGAEIHLLMQTLGVRQRGGTLPLNFSGRI